jgi:hypothetical protein
MDDTIRAGWQAWAASRRAQETGRAGAQLQAGRRAGYAAIAMRIDYTSAAAVTTAAILKARGSSVE